MYANAARQLNHEIQYDASQAKNARLGTVSRGSIQTIIAHEEK